MLVQYFGAPLILTDLHRMLSTIKLDHQMMFRAAKIHDKVADRMLAPEFCRIQLTGAQILPQLAFGVGLPPPQAAHTRTDRWHISIHRPSPLPSPRRGEGDMGGLFGYRFLQTGRAVMPHRMIFLEKRAHIGHIFFDPAAQFVQ